MLIKKDYSGKPFAKKAFKFEVKEFGDEEGTIEGFASTNDLDRTNDIITEDALKRAIKLLKEEGIDMIPMKFMHQRDQIIGGFPVDKTEVKDGNFFVQGKFTKGVQKAQEAFALIKADVLKTFSIGFYILDAEWKDDVRIIKELFITEISIVDIPANAAAKITNIKNIESLDALKAVETLLKDNGFSSKEAKTLISKIQELKAKPENTGKPLVDDLEEEKKLTGNLTQFIKELNAFSDTIKS
jgi:HK97 family phage prohead protease